MPTEIADLDLFEFEFVLLVAQTGAERDTKENKRLDKEQAEKIKGLKRGKK